MSANGRHARLERLEQRVPGCPKCGGWPVRVAMVYDDHTDENMPSMGCPACARRPVENVVIDLRGGPDDDPEGWPA